MTPPAPDPISPAPVLDYGRPRPGWVRPSWGFVACALAVSLGASLLMVGWRYDGRAAGEDAATFAGVGTFLLSAGGFGLLAVLRPGLGRQSP